MSVTQTRGVRIAVFPDYVPEQSDPVGGRWLFAYRIQIHNGGDEAVQLLSRHWIITTGNGTTEEVRGPGVVGQQPRLAAGESFEYTSFCPLDTPVGTMHGSFQMVTEGGDNFDAQISPFRLAEPGVLN